MTCPVGRHCGSWYGIHMKWELLSERLVVYLTSGMFHQSMVRDWSFVLPTWLRVEALFPRCCCWGKNDATGTALSWTVRSLSDARTSAAEIFKFFGPAPNNHNQQPHSKCLPLDLLSSAQTAVISLKPRRETRTQFCFAIVVVRKTKVCSNYWIPRPEA